MEIGEKINHLTAKAFLDKSIIDVSRVDAWFLLPDTLPIDPAAQVVLTCKINKRGPSGVEFGQHQALIKPWAFL